MSIKVLYITAMIIALLISIIELTLTYRAYVNHAKKGKKVTNRYIFSEMLSMLMILGGAFKLTVSNRGLDEWLSKDAKYIVGIILALFIGIYMLSKHGYIKRQYIFKNNHFYKYNDDNNKLPDSYIQVMYKDEDKTDKVAMYIDYKRYYIDMNEKEYVETRKRLSSVALKKCEKINSMQQKFFSNLMVFKIMIIISTLVVFPFAMYYRGAMVYKVIAMAGMVIIILLMLIYFVIEKIRRDRLVKRIINGENI